MKKILSIIVLMIFGVMMILSIQVCAYNASETYIINGLLQGKYIMKYGEQSMERIFLRVLVMYQ